MRNYLLRKIAATILVPGLLCLMLASCVTLKLPPEPHQHFTRVPYAQRRVLLQRIKQWDIKGAFSLTYLNKVTMANFDWRQHQLQGFDIRIHSALNLVSATIQGNPNFATLWLSNTKKYSARTPELLMRLKLGWSWPVTDLYYWVRGLPAKSYYRARYDRYGHIIRLHQDGWTVRFSNYGNYGPVDLPRMLRLSSSHTRIKIAIQQWQARMDKPPHH